MHDDGILYVAVPNIGYMKGTEWFHCAHLYYFSESTIKIFFDKVGLEIVKIESYKPKSELWYILKKSDSIYKKQLDKITRYLDG